MFRRPSAVQSTENGARWRGKGQPSGNGNLLRNQQVLGSNPSAGSGSSSKTARSLPASGAAAPAGQRVRPESLVAVGCQTGPHSVDTQRPASLQPLHRLGQPGV